jgi:hypothetical protein
MIGIVDGVDDDAEVAENRAPLNEQKAPRAASSNVTPQLSPPGREMPQAEAPIASKLSEAQVNRLYAIANSSNWPKKYSEAYLNEAFKKRAKDLNKAQYDEACEWLKNNKCNEEYKKELEKYVLNSSPVMQAYEQAKKAKYVDHTTPAPGFDDHEPLPF